jgi:hypothetical protein
MRSWRTIFLLILVSLNAPVRVPAQEGAPPKEPPPAQETDTAAAATPVVFSLIPLLEAAFSGELYWRPDWPVDIPPDGFALVGEKNGPPRGSLMLTLINETESFSFSRDSAGRLTEFPYFSRNDYLKIKAAYDSSGAIVSLKVSAPVPAGDDKTGDAAVSSENDSAPAKAAEEKNARQIWDVEFPPDFFPYSDYSPGGVFPPVKVSSEDAAFFVVLHESPVFLSETWYDGEGNTLAHFKAPVRVDNGAWRVLSLQTWDAAGARGEDYFFDSGGNISEVRSQAGTFSALYRDKRPLYWNRQPDSEGAAARSSLQWDEGGFLLYLRFEDTAPALPVEYHYEYERNAAGYWIKRRDIAIIAHFGVFAPRLERTWTRRIGFAED